VFPASYGLDPYSILLDDRAIAQAVSRWFSTAAAGVWARVWSSEICGGQSTSVSPANLYSTKSSNLIIIRGRYSRPEVAAVTSGPCMDSTPLPNIQIIKKSPTIAQEVSRLEK
jgi:hypothetical protein